MQMFRDFRRPCSGQGQGKPLGGGEFLSPGGPGSGSVLQRTASPPSPECPRQEQDIVFLIDGSSSISPSDFAKMLSFVKAVMSQFQRPSTQVCLRGREGRWAGPRGGS